MKINTRTNKLTFESLETGEVFERIDYVYLKIKDLVVEEEIYNAINLTTNMIARLSPEAGITLLKASLEIVN